MDFDSINTGIYTNVGVGSIEKNAPEFNPITGAHFWIMVGSWKCDPEKVISGELFLLDHENQLGINGPGCWHCEEQYTKLIASRRCKGHP
jgi:hypothetical protein